MSFRPRTMRAVTGLLDGICHRLNAWGFTVCQVCHSWTLATRRGDNWHWAFFMPLWVSSTIDASGRIYRQSRQPIRHYFVPWGIRMSEEQRRRNPRYAFIASAELFEPNTRTRMATRVTELSKQGCYLDTLNPFPEDTIALVKISAGDAVFETRVRVVYAHSNLGVGLVFLEPDAKNMEVLNGWIEEAQTDPQRLLP
jgi:hypothetical protein